MINLATSSSSVKAYGKVDEAEQRELVARRKTRKRIAIISISSIFLVAIVVGAVVGVTQKNDHQGKNNNSDALPISTSIKAACDVTLYPDTCLNSLSPLASNNSNGNNLQPLDIFKLAIQVALAEVKKVSQDILVEFGSVNDASASKAALKDCQQLFDLAIDHLNESISSIDAKTPLHDLFDDLLTWLSAAGTYHDTCLEGLQNANVGLKNQIEEILKNSTEMTSNSLAIVSWISKVASSFKLKRRLMSEPEWLSSGDRMLLRTVDLRKTADIVVAKDGSSKYKTIKAALKAVPEKSKKRTVIYVKKGVYYENVRVEKTMWNVTMVGDGMHRTIVSSNLNVVDGTPTFSSATFAVFGKGFIAQDMGFRNTAGPAKHQAVALMSTADMSIFYRCYFDAFQDTLYLHSNRQFYRQCDIYGTVDFIFGNSASVLQSCNILPKQPMKGQKNTITAQGKVDPNQNTGISIQNCNIVPGGKLSSSLETYLGRPWKVYSTTVFVNTYMGSLIAPAGWLPWVGTTAPDTIFYAEFQNYGPGSSKKNRVKWKGLKSITSSIAAKFTAKPFIQGDKWIPSGVTYKAGL